MYLSYHLYTEIPALFFVLFAIFSFDRRFYALAGFSAALAFLTKFPAGLFFAAILLVLLLKKQFKDSIRFTIAFLIPAVLFFIFNFFMYGNFLIPLIDAKLNILTVIGCNLLREQPWWFYFAMIFRENWFNVFALPGLFLFFRKFRFKRLLPVFCLLFPLIYFSSMHCRDYRYLMLFIPFVALFSGFGISYFLEKREKAFFFIIIMLLGFSVFKAVWFISDNEIMIKSPASQGYFNFLKDKNAVGEVWTVNPVVSAYSDFPLKKIYYPIYDEDSSVLFYDYLMINDYHIQYVFLDNCGGGILCYPTDKVCAVQRRQTLEYLEKNFNKVYNEKSGRCAYVVYENPLF
jgi:hypothetical protein